uniref:Uncharacterized protein n=1 Tax=Romanomermis culicivorax TaxID=13658 RepID=A0A915KGK7_ROMCU
MIDAAVRVSLNAALQESRKTILITLKWLERMVIKEETVLIIQFNDTKYNKHTVCAGMKTRAL